MTTITALCPSPGPSPSAVAQPQRRPLEDARARNLRLIGPHDGRYLHLIDVENLVGGTATATQVRDAIGIYVASGIFWVGDQVVVAVSRRFSHSLFEIPGGWQRRVAGNGRDAADLVLLEWASVDFVANRFDGVVIASGDGIFTSLATASRAHGLRTVVVTGGGWIATELYRACHEHVALLGCTSGAA